MSEFFIMTIEIQQIVIALFGFIGTILFGMNVYFIKKLVEKVEKTSDEVIKINKDLNGIGASLREVKTDVKEFETHQRNVEIQLGIIKALHEHREKTA